MRQGQVGELQRRAWGFYGWPGANNLPVGEVHYVNAWLADQMTRLDWDVEIDGSPDWEVQLPDGSTINTTRPGPVDDQGAATTVEDQTAASTELLNFIDWDDTNVRSVTTNLFVAGQGDYIWDYPRDTWRVVSVVETNRRDTVKAARERVPFIWPHPADVSMPDAPLFSVLEILEELTWYNRQATTQSRQRALISGIVAISDTFVGPNGGDFWDEWNANLSAKMTNPDDLSPIRLKGPYAEIKEGVNWVIPDFPYDDVLDKRVEGCINRLAYGLPVPPEILLGMQAQSRATAFQVEENAYRAHIEPPAHLIAQVAEDALSLLIDREVRVIPNATRLLSRRNSVEDVKWARDNHLVTDAYTREVLGIPEDAAPDPPDVPAPTGDQPIEPDPENVVVGEPITAAISDETDDDLSALLADIDTHLSSELAGASAMATDRARKRLGASARQRIKAEAQGRPDADLSILKLSNERIAQTLGLDGLANVGVDVAAQITEPIESAAGWWERRITQAWAQTATLIPGWSGQTGWVSASSDALVTALAAHVQDTLSEPEPSPLDAEQIRELVDAAAGGS